MPLRVVCLLALAGILTIAWRFGRVDPSTSTTGTPPPPEPATAAADRTPPHLTVPEARKRRIAEAPVPLATIAVEAGRTTWVDLDGLGPIRLRGRVLDEHGSLSGAQVRWSSLWKTTDADGRFEFRTSFPLTMWVEFEVLRGRVSYTIDGQAMAQDQTELEVELRVGSQTLEMLAFDEHGAPSTATVSLSLAQYVDEPADRVRADSLAIPDSGVLALPGLPHGMYRVSATFPSGFELSQSATFFDPADYIVLRALPTGDLDITLRTHDGQPASGLSLEVESWSGTGEMPARGIPSCELRSRTAQPDAQGRALVRGVVAGHVRVSVHDLRARRLLPDTAGPTTPEPQRLELVTGERAQLLFELPPP